MAVRDKVLILVLSLAALFWFLDSVSQILFPFIAALVISYLLNPFVDRLEKLRIPRFVAVLIIIAGSISIITLFFVVITPILYHELVGLLSSLPEYYDIFLSEFYPKIVNMVESAGYEVNYDFREYFNQENIVGLFSFSNNIVNTITRSSMAFLNVLSLLFITPILVFYILKDWHILVDNVNNNLPKKYAKEIRQIFTDIHRNLTGFIRGQFNVCVILGLFYSMGLLAIGLNFGFVIGFLTGLFSFLPYIGMLMGVIIATIVGLFQWGFDVTHLALMAAVFVLGQCMEAGFLTPKLIGDKIGLHPVWVIFAIFAFGSLFGFAGILLAVPFAAIIAVIAEFLIKKYKQTFLK